MEALILLMTVLLDPVTWLIYRDVRRCRCRRASVKPERTWRPYFPEDSRAVSDSN